MERFQNKYRIQSARLKNWDYGRNASYFVTICTDKRKCYLGEIKNGEMVLSETGKLARRMLLQIPEQYNYAFTDEFIVMPNHVHAIVIINKIDDVQDKDVENNDDTHRREAINYTGRDAINQTDRDAINQTDRDAINRVSTTTTSGKPGGITGINNPMLHDNISRILNWYKGRVTFESRKINQDFGWQSRFHDHIIRNEEEYQRIKNYIINNPKNWNDDSLNIKS